nr:uncharacterized protein LOC115490998 [Taeniopygia guttata]
MASFVWFLSGGRILSIHPLQTTLSLEYGPLGSFWPAVVFLVEAERAMAFAGKTKGKWGSQNILCRCRPSAVTREHLGACHLDLYREGQCLWLEESLAQRRKQKDQRGALKGLLRCRAVSECEVRAGPALPGVEPQQSPGRARSSLSLGRGRLQGGPCSCRRHSPALRASCWQRAHPPLSEAKRSRLLPRGSGALLGTAQPGGIGPLESAPRRERPRAAEGRWPGSAFPLLCRLPCDSWQRFGRAVFCHAKKSAVGCLKEPKGLITSLTFLFWSLSHLFWWLFLITKHHELTSAKAPWRSS